MNRLLLIPCFLLLQLIAHAQLPAFPGAEGFGAQATGGRGGQVAIVSNLNDEGPGSFRDALTQYPGQPLTVVFSVSGTIDLQSNLQIRRSNLTIAGQSAPGQGICLKNFSFMLNGAGAGGNKGNIIIRYIRSRPGGTLKSGLYGFDMENCHDVIIDHCSFSWANEECAAMYDMKNITVQWCIVSEGLYEAGHHKGHRSYGGVWGGQNASYHHNLIASQNSRTVRFNGARAHDTLALIDYVNNVIWNWGNQNAPYGGDVKIPGGRSMINMINNYYKPGPATAPEHKFMEALYEPGNNTGVGEWFLKGNVMEDSRSLTNENNLGLDLSQLPQNLRSKALAPQAFPAPQVYTLPAAEAYRQVGLMAGASKERDAVDQRVYEEMTSGKPKGIGVFGKPGIIDSPAAVGGWAKIPELKGPEDQDRDGMPDAYELSKGLNPNDPSDRNQLTSTGYTQLEAYLNGLLVKPKKLTKQ